MVIEMVVVVDLLVHRDVDGHVLDHGNVLHHGDVHLLNVMVVVGVHLVRDVDHDVFAKEENRECLISRRSYGRSISVYLLCHYVIGRKEGRKWR